MNSDKKFIIGIAVLTVAVFAGIVLLTNKSNPETSQENSTTVTEDKKMLLNIVTDDWTKGNKQSKVILVEYLDFECEACGAYYPLVKTLSEEFENDVLFVNRYYPLPGHKNSMTAASAAEAAGKQGKYWEMHDLLFDNQQSWGEKPAPDPKIFEEYATQIGLNLEQYKIDVKSPEVKDRIARDKSSGTKLEVTGTPTFFLNGQKIQNPSSIEDFRTLIKAEVLKSPVKKSESTGEKVHEHADLALFVNGERVLLQDRPEYFEKDPNIHSHVDTEEVIHKHKTGTTLGELIESWDANFPSTVEWYLNGTKQDNNWKEYEFKDLDRLVMSFSDAAYNLTNEQVSFVTDRACVYSEKCPERGTPPTENCVGGLGTDC